MIALVTSGIWHMGLQQIICMTLPRCQCLSPLRSVMHLYQWLILLGMNDRVLSFCKCIVCWVPYHTCGDHGFLIWTVDPMIPIKGAWSQKYPIFTIQYVQKKGLQPKDVSISQSLEDCGGILHWVGRDVLLWELSTSANCSFVVRSG